MENTNRKSHSLLDQAILLGIASTIFVAIRVLAISRGDLNLAETLLSNLDPLKIFLSSLRPLADYICFLLGIYLLRQRKIAVANQTDETLLTISVAAHATGILLILIGVVFINAISAIAIVALSIINAFHAFFLRFDLWKRSLLRLKLINPLNLQSRRFTKKHFYYDTALVTSILFIFYTFFIPTMWVPTENLYVKNLETAPYLASLNAPAPITVYVLNADSNYLTVLDASTLSGEVYNRSDIQYREVCSESGRGLATYLFSLSLFAHIDYLNRACAEPSNVSLLWKNH